MHTWPNLSQDVALWIMSVSAELFHQINDFKMGDDNDSDNFPFLLSLLSVRRPRTPVLAQHIADAVSTSLTVKHILHVCGR